MCPLNQNVVNERTLMPFHISQKIHNTCQKNLQYNTIIVKMLEKLKKCSAVIKLPSLQMLPKALKLILGFCNQIFLVHLDEKYNILSIYTYKQNISHPLNITVDI